MKSSKISSDVLYVPFYLRSFNVCEKIILALSIFASAFAVASIPFVLSSIQTLEQTTTTTIYSSEIQLWETLGEKK